MESDGNQSESTNNHCSLHETEDGDFSLRLSLLQNLLSPIAKEVLEQQVLSSKLENALSATSHRSLLEEERKLCAEEANILNILGTSHLEYKKAVNAVAEAKECLISGYMGAITSLEALKARREELHRTFLDVAKNQKLAAAYPVEDEEKVETMDASCSNKEFAILGSVAVGEALTEKVNTLKAPRLSDFGISEELKSLLTKKSCSVKAGAAPESVADKTNQNNPFEADGTESTFSANLTPVVFGNGPIAATPADQLNNVSSSIRKFRNESTKSDKKCNASNEKDGSAGPPVSLGAKRTLKHSKGSMNGSWIEENDNDALLLPEKFEGRIPLDFNVEETQFGNLDPSYSKSPDPAALISAKKPQLPKLCATDMYNAARLVGPPSESEEVQAAFPLSKVLKRPEMPKLCATDLYDVSKIVNEKPKILGGAFKEVSSKKKGARGNFPEAVENYRRSVCSAPLVDETFTVIKDKTVLGSALEENTAAFRVKPFTRKEYDTLKPMIRENMSEEKLNIAVELLNQFLASDKGMKSFSRKDLLNVVGSRLDKCEAILFSSALSESGKLERMREAKK